MPARATLADINADILVPICQHFLMTNIPGDTMSGNVIIDLKIGDKILTGRFKNKRDIVKSISVDNLGQPTVNGKPMLKFRIEKAIPKDKKK